VNQSFSRSRNSPFDGRTFHGGPVATVVNGRIAWRRDQPDA
jgi:dihydroorotase-like cyclic amidohydrolase